MTKAFRKPPENIVIVFGGAIGDAIVFFDALGRLSQHQQACNRGLYFICKTPVARFLRAARPDIQVEIIQIDGSEFIRNPRYRHYVRSLLPLKSSILVSPHRSKFAEVVCCLMGVSRRIELRENIKMSKISPLHLLNKAAYNEHVFVPANSMAFERFRVLLTYLGCDSYETALSRWTKNAAASQRAGLLTGNSPYCVLSPTTAEPAKTWEFEKFRTAAIWVLENTNLNICVTGGNEAKGYCSRLKVGLSSEFEGRLIDCVSKTDSAEWIELVRDACFCFGNDSATTHIAAHVGTPSICVTPGFNYGYCQPYKLDVVHDEDEVPQCLYAYKDCFGCYLRNYGRCDGNPDCKAAVKAGKPYLCIQDISVEQALAALETLVSRLKLKKETIDEAV
jgi:ADP-heptose:LPS heptosyltransferase